MGREIGGMLAKDNSGEPPSLARAPFGCGAAMRSNFGQSMRPRRNVAPAGWAQRARRLVEGVVVTALMRYRPRAGRHSQQLFLQTKVSPRARQRNVSRAGSSADGGNAAAHLIRR